MCRENRSRNNVNVQHCSASIDKLVDALPLRTNRRANEYRIAHVADHGDIQPNCVRPGRSASAYAFFSEKTTTFDRELSYA
jgi:hypothetical protein